MNKLTWLELSGLYTIKDDLPSNIESCPHCGCNDGYYRKYTASGTLVLNFNFNCNEVNNNNIINQIKLSDGKAIYCIVCDKRITVISEEELRN